MRLLYSGKDGGKKSTVDGIWLIELKKLFSIVFLKFNKGSREAYHSHAFNAYTWFISGEVMEYHKDGRVLKWKPSIFPKYTPRDCFHKVYAVKDTWAFTIRGPWKETWQEWFRDDDKTITLTHGRKII